MQIRCELPADAEEVAHLLMGAFGRPHEALLVEDLRSAGKVVIALVAEVDGRIAGNVVFTEVTIEPPGPDWMTLGLAPLGVLPEMQGRGIGTALVKNGIEECRKAGYAAVAVVGDPAYYSKFGFAGARRFGLASEYDVGDAFMALEIVPGALTKAAGVVRFQSQFDTYG